MGRSLSGTSVCSLCVETKVARSVDMIWRIGNKEIKGKRYVEGTFRTGRISVDINAHLTSLQEIFLAEELSIIM